MELILKAKPLLFPTSTSHSDKYFTTSVKDEAMVNM